MFTKDEVMRYMHEAPDAFIRDKLILLIGVYTGLRCDTIAKLEWRHIALLTPCPISLGALAPQNIRQLHGDVSLDTTTPSHTLTIDRNPQPLVTRV